MDKQKIIILIASLVVISGAAFAFWYFQKSYETPLFRTQESVSNSSDSKEPCIITVRGEKYDVAEFRNKHKGGNIFKCGEDMTEAFNKQHGDKQLRDLQKYKVQN